MDDDPTVYATPSNSSSSSASSLGGFAFGVGVSIGVVFLILVITISSYLCSGRSRDHPPVPHQQQPGGSIYGQQAAIEILELGLDEATLRSYPKLLYSQARSQKGDSTPSSCSICLGDYKSTDTLRLLPDCGHVFHVGCVDPWLRHHPTCPICRSSPLPTPLSTPLAEVAPLAAASYR